MPVDPARTLPVSQLIADGIAAHIERGKLGPGDRLPSVRQLALEQRVSLATALQALRALESRGLVEARPQSGYYVRRRPRRLEEPLAELAPGGARAVDVERHAAAVESRAAGHAQAAALGGWVPAAGFVPVQRLRRLIAVGVNEAPGMLARAPAVQGHAALRAQLARRHAELGAAIDADAFIVTQGATEALALALRAVTQPGDLVVLESPAWPSTLRTLEALGLQALEVPTHPRDGLSLETLEAMLDGHDVRAALLTANVGGPLGANPTDGRRRLLVATLEMRGITVIADDTGGDLPFEGARPRPLKAFERAGGVILCGACAQTVAPGIGIGWIAAGRHHARVATLKAATVGGTPELASAALAAFLGQGGYELHLRHLRRAFALQVLQTADAIAEHFPAGTRVARPAGGHGLWVELPPGIDTLAWHARAVAAGAGYAPGRLFAAGDAYAQALRVECGQPWSNERGAAIGALGRLFVEALGAPPGTT
jgi:DNA-binding transcriptional MocR family regulator